MAIAGIQKLLDPEVFVVGGGVASVGTYFYTHVQQYARDFAGGFSDVTILPAEFGVEAGAIGAAIAARQMTAQRQAFPCLAPAAGESRTLTLTIDQAEVQTPGSK